MDIKRVTLAGVLVAVAVLMSAFSIPIGPARCFPVQHLVNVLAAVLLGPFYGVAMAFVTSVLRLSLGTGTLLAFPGSMCGALLSGLAYRRYGKQWAAFLGEVIGTGVLGALLAFPVAAFLLSRSVAIFAFVIPFGISTLGGSVIALVLLKALKKTHVIEKWKGMAI